MRKCKTCHEDIARYVEQRSHFNARKRAPDNTHFHYGIAYYRYGICVRHHYTRFEKAKVIWDPCIKCKFKGVTNYKLPKTELEEKEEEIVSLRFEVNALKEEMKKYREEYSHELNSIKKSMSCDTVHKKNDSIEMLADLCDFSELVNMCDTGLKRDAKTNIPFHDLDDTISETSSLDLKWSKNKFSKFKKPN